MDPGWAPGSAPSLNVSPTAAGLREGIPPQLLEGDPIGSYTIGALAVGGLTCLLLFSALS